ncbi:PREDICTED: uncharacterized protein LOC104606680 isoform X2 [Nelumbo nucifera]|uniref:Uncharacterized protein LOC104606680 isoform X2 n=1 Tax=Nelumbo nucifera TaxID=4432 RepID=A0A1U8Q9X2_NELNU|nr:PREDICTED: uncharacterized protein LOC104606680 isoform X2 [Nelumbo nucifera]
MGLFKLSGNIGNLRSDYTHDPTIARNRKRRRLNSGGFKPDSFIGNREEALHSDPEDQIPIDDTEDQVDGDYKIFLKILGVDSDAESTENDVDPDYKMFMDNLKEDGKSFIYERMKKNGKFVAIRYAEEDDLSDKKKIEGQSSGDHFPSGEGKDSMLEEDLKLEPLTPCGEDSCAIKKYCPVGFYTPFPDSKNETKISTVDESYSMFLKNVKVDGYSMILVDEDGNTVKYEDDYPSPTKSESLGAESPLDCSAQDLNSSMDESDCSCIESQMARNLSEYRDNLIAVLRKPYSWTEYEKLLSDATNQKQVERHRDLRGGLKIYQTEQTGASYVDYFPEFIA